MSRWLKQFLAESSPPLIAAFIRGLALTLRYRLEDPQGILGMDPNRIMNRFGIDGARGSSSRGGSDALRELLRELERPQARDIGITPDGPRGPRGKVQDGVLALAAGSGRAVYPVTTRYSRFWELPSWDRFQIPKPGALCRVVVGPAVAPPKSLEPLELDRVRGELERALGD